VFDSTFSTATGPGLHAYGFSNRGTAQNYIVTSSNAGSLQVQPRPVTVTAANAESLVGAVPPLGASISEAPAASGPQFTLGVRAWTDRRNDDGTVQIVPLALSEKTPAGEYRLRVDILPAAGTTLAEVQRHYQFNFIEGRLQLDRSLTELSKVTLGPDVQLDHEVIFIGPTLTDFKPTPFTIDVGDSTVKVHSPAAELQEVFGAVQSWTGLYGYVRLTEGSTDPAAVLAREFQAGRLTEKALWSMAEKNPAAKDLIVDLLSRAVFTVGERQVGGDSPPIAKILPDLVEGLNRIQNKRIAEATARYAAAVKKIEEQSSSVFALFDPGRPTALQAAQAAFKNEMAQMKVLNLNATAHEVFNTFTEADLRTACLVLVNRVLGVSGS